MEVLKNGLLLSCCSFIYRIKGRAWPALVVLLETTTKTNYNDGIDSDCDGSADVFYAASSPYGWSGSTSSSAFGSVIDSKDIDGDGASGGIMGKLDLTLDDQLTRYGTIFADIKRIRSTKDRTLDGQLEDIRDKENSQTLHFLIWSGLAILIILMVIQRMRK